MLYFLPSFSLYSNNFPGARACYAFGDLTALRAGDKYHCLLTGYNAGSWSSTGQASGSYFANLANTTNKALARSYHQLVGAVAAQWRGYYSNMGEGLSFPNPADNGFYVSTDPVPVHDNLSLRGYLPGIVVPYATATAYDGVNLKNLPALPNKIVRLICSAYFGGSSADYRRLIGFDIKGPWR